MIALEMEGISWALTLDSELERMGGVLFRLDQPHLELMYCWHRDLDLTWNLYMESVDLKLLGILLNQDQMLLFSFASTYGERTHNLLRKRGQVFIFWKDKFALKRKGCIAPKSLLVKLLELRTQFTKAWGQRSFSFW